MCAEIFVWFQVCVHVHSFRITYVNYLTISADACIFSLQIVPAAVYQLTLCTVFPLNDYQFCFVEIILYLVLYRLVIKYDFMVKRTTYFIVGQVYTNFTKIWELSPNCRCRKGDKKLFPYWWPTMLEWPVNLTFIWWFLHGACGLIDAFCMCRKNCNNCSRNIKCLCTQFSCLLPRHLGFVHSWCRWSVNSWNKIQFPSYESENKNTGRGVSLSWRTRLQCGLSSAQASGLTTWGTWPRTAVLSSVCTFTLETLQLPSAREEGYSHQQLTQVIHVCE